MSYISRSQPVPLEYEPVAIERPGLVVVVAAILIFAIFFAALWARPPVPAADEPNDYLEVAL